MRITPLTLIIFVVLAAGGWLFYSANQDDGPKPAPDRHADVETGPIDQLIVLFQRSWDVADMDGLRALTMPAEADDDSGGPIRTLEKRIQANNWGVNIPAIESISTERPDKVRFTLTCKLVGYSTTVPLKVWWEWTGDSWRIASWKIPDAA